MSVSDSSFISSTIWVVSFIKFLAINYPPKQNSKHHPTYYTDLIKLHHKPSPKLQPQNKFSIKYIYVHYMYSCNYTESNFLISFLKQAASKNESLEKVRNICNIELKNK